MTDKDKRQLEQPFLKACVDYMNSSPVPFDVPGHKMGRLTNDLVDYAGENIFKADFNAPLGLDNLYHPSGVIKQAQELAAEAFHADKAIFSVNGTTGGILTILIACQIFFPLLKALFIITIACKRPASIVFLFFL